MRRNAFSPRQTDLLRPALLSIVALSLVAGLGQADAQQSRSIQSRSLQPASQTTLLQPRSGQILHGHVRPVVANGQAAPVGQLPPAQRLHLAIQLPLRNQSGLTSLLGRIHDPLSSDYRHFLSVAQFTEQFGPSAENYQAVVDFARANGLTVTATPSNRMLVDVTGTAAQIEKAFHVTMMVYQHPTENRTFYSPDREPSLELSVPIAHIAGLNDFSIPRPMITRALGNQGARSNATGSGPGGSFLASDMRAAYYGSGSLTGAGQAVGLFEFSGYNLSDVDLTFSSVGQSYSVPINNVLLDGSDGQPNGDDAEEVLDIVQAIAMAPGLSQVRVYISPGIDVDILNQMATENIAKQLSCSWLWYPEDASSDDPIFQEFAAQGQNFFVASGDHGAYTNYDVPFYFPAEDAYVTAVGGTSLTTNGAGGPWESETAWNGNSSGGYVASGGGVSPDGIVLPNWQIDVANSSNAASMTVRNVPDVAAEGDTDNYVCDMGVCDGGFGGTSFAAPRWAGFLALVNEQVVASGQPSVGFINPVIYAIGKSANYASDFHDVSSGNNDITAGLYGGFNAVAGYDLVTGWGSPNGQNLINALPAPGFAVLASPGSLTIGEGGSGSATIRLSNANGFSGVVALTASGLPEGVTASFNPASISGTGTSKLTLTANNSVTNGNATVTVTGASGSMTASTTIALSVNFALSVSPSLQTVIAGQNAASYKAKITMKSGFTGSVDLGVTGLPAGAKAKFNPPSLSASGTSTLSIATTSATPPGSYALTVTATSGSLKQTTNATLVVNAVSSDFTLTASSSTLTVSQLTGGIGSMAFTVTSENNFSGPVTLSAAGIPGGELGTFSPNPVIPAADGTVTSVLNLAEVIWPAPYGTFPVTVTGTSGNEVATSKINLTIDPFLFAFGVGNGERTINPGSSITMAFDFAGENNFTSPITLAASGLPSGVTAVFSPNPVSMSIGWGVSTLTLTADATTPVGVYTMNLTATSGSFVQTLQLPLTVSSSGFTIKASPLTLTQGKSGSAKLTLTSQNGFAGTVELQLASPPTPDGVTVFEPVMVNVPANGTATATMSISTDAATTIGKSAIPISASIFQNGSFLFNNANIPLTVVANGGPTYVTLMSAFNRQGIYLDGLDIRNVTLGLDNHGLAYSGELLDAWSKTWDNTPFYVPGAYYLSVYSNLVFDNVSGAGQTIPLPSGRFSFLRMLGTAVNGNQILQPFVVTYTDGSIATFTQNLSDWRTPQNYSGESEALSMAYADNLLNGGRIARPTYLYGYSFAIDKARGVASITIPNNANVEVVAMTLVP